MAWISLAIVTLVFFTPEIGLSGEIQRNMTELVISLPWLAFKIDFPYLGSVWLLIYSGLSWLILWVFLVTIQEIIPTSSRFYTLTHGDELFITRPFLSLRISFLLSNIVLSVITISIVTIIALWLMQFVIDSISPLFNNIYRYILSNQIDLSLIIISLLIRAAMIAWVQEVSFRKANRMKKFPRRLRHSPYLTQESIMQ